MVKGSGCGETWWQGKIQQYYDIDKKKIGEGSYGSVCKARNKADSAEFRFATCKFPIFILNKTDVRDI